MSISSVCKTEVLKFSDNLIIRNFTNSCNTSEVEIWGKILRISDKGWHKSYRSMWNYFWSTVSCEKVISNLKDVGFHLMEDRLLVFFASTFFLFYVLLQHPIGTYLHSHLRHRKRVPSRKILKGLINWDEHLEMFRNRKKKIG